MILGNISSKSSGLWAWLFVVHNIVTHFVIRNVIHNTKLWPFSVIINDKRSQFSIMNDISNNIVVHNPIPTTWAKLVQNSFAKKKEIHVKILLHQVQGKYYSISFVVHWTGSVWPLPSLLYLNTRKKVYNWYLYYHEILFYV